jgi:MFS family permease
VPEQAPNWRRTFRLDLGRSVPQGFVETAFTTFAVFLAESVFRAPAGVKIALVASSSLGLLLSLFALQVVRRLGWSVNRAAASVWVAAAAGFGLAAAGSGMMGYAAGMSTGMMFLTMGAPLLAQVYRTSYPNEIRGRLFAAAGMSRAITGAVAGLLVAGALLRDPGNWPWLCAGYGVACLAMAGLVLLMPGVSVSSTNRLQLFDAFRHVREDPPFRKLLQCWMLLGIGNLLAMAFFVEYVTNPRYGIGYDAGRVGLLTTTLPMVAFVVCIVAWGVLFDRVNFYLLRVAINVLFVAGIACYFFGGSFGMLATGIVLHGVARAGGNVAWSLWVTKFASAERVAEYMSVHTFLTGCRGVLAPAISFGVAAWLGPKWMAGAGITLIILSSLLLAPEVRLARAKRKGYAIDRRPVG